MNVPVNWVITAADQRGRAAVQPGALGIGVPEDVQCYARAMWQLGHRRSSAYLLVTTDLTENFSLPCDVLRDFVTEPEADLISRAILVTQAG